MVEGEATSLCACQKVNRQTRRRVFRLDVHQKRCVSVDVVTLISLWG